MSTARLRGRAFDALVVAAFLGACAVGMGGLATSKYAGDIATYAHYGRLLVLHGKVPYHDFYYEYPPGAVPVFALPALLWDAHYHVVFKLLMAACGAVAVWASLRTLTHLRADATRRAVAAVALVVAPAAIGPVFLNRYDPLPAMLVSLALLALLRGRDRTSFALLGVAFAVKVYPAALLPVAALRIWRRKGARALVAPFATFVGVAAAFFAYFLVVAFGGLGYSFYTQAIRHLQIESLGSSLLLAADKLGLYESHWIPGKPGSIDLGGRLPDAVGTLSSLLSLVVIVVVAAVYARGRDDDERLVTAFAATVCAFVALGKVLSPQYLTWLFPLVPLVAGRRGLAATGAFVAAMALTPVEYFLGDHGLRNVNWTVWVLLLRDALLVATLALVCAQLARGVDVVAEARRLRRAAAGRLGARRDVELAQRGETPGS